MAVSPYQPSQPAGNFFKGIDFTSSDSITKGIGAGATSLNQQGSDLTSSGLSALQPVFGQLMKLLSGDQNAINTATQPQVRSIVDSYDAARKATAQFSPRGGGQATALTKSRFNEASDIAGVKSNAITSATKDLAGLGTSLLNAGASEQAASLQSLFGLLTSAKQDEASTREMWGQIGMHAGKIAAAYFTGGASIAAVGI